MDLHSDTVSDVFEDCKIHRMQNYDDDDDDDDDDDAPQQRRVLHERINIRYH